MAKAKPIVGLNIHASTAANARIIAQTRLAEVYAWEQYVDNPYHVRELHNMRIATKRLRYTLEIFVDVLPASLAPFLKEVEQLQEELGMLHDSDVMIALLRLCLGAQDAGSGYEYALAEAHKTLRKADFAINPALVTCLLDLAVAPSAAQRQGLESFLQDLQQQRNVQYATFRQHWYALVAQEFRNKLLNTLKSE